MRLFPYRRALRKDVTWGPWQVHVDDGQPETLGDRIKGWDYQSTLTLERDVDVDRSKISRSTGLLETVSLALVSTVDCATSGERLVFQEIVPSETSLVRMSLNVPPGLFAEAITLRSSLVLGEDSRADEPGVADIKGQRLLDDNGKTVALEGDGSRFPTQAVSFEDSGFETALWSLSLEAASLESSVASGMRLYVNTDLPASKRIAMGVDCSHVRFLQMDIARRVIAFAASVAASGEPIDSEWPEGSIGETAKSLAEGTLGSDLSACIQLLDREPGRFERLLQTAFRPWEEK